MPADRCCQERLVTAVASRGRGSAEHIAATNLLVDLTQRRGLDYIFKRWDIDAILLPTEMSTMAMIIGAAGYPAASEFISSARGLTGKGNSTAWLLRQWPAVWDDDGHSTSSRKQVDWDHVGSSTFS